MRKTSRGLQESRLNKNESFKVDNLKIKKL